MFCSVYNASFLILRIFRSNHQSVEFAAAIVHLKGMRLRLQSCSRSAIRHQLQGLLVGYSKVNPDVIHGRSELLGHHWNVRHTLGHSSDLWSGTSNKRMNMQLFRLKENMYKPLLTCDLWHWQVNLVMALGQIDSLIWAKSSTCGLCRLMSQAFASQIGISTVL